jgi:hypothetical protein
LKVAARIPGELVLPIAGRAREDASQSEGRGSAGAWLLPLTGLAGQALLSATFIRASLALGGDKSAPASLA